MRKVLISAGASGIGYTLAQRFSDAGYPAEIKTFCIKKPFNLKMTSRLNYDLSRQFFLDNLFTRPS